MKLGFNQDFRSTICCCISTQSLARTIIWRSAASNPVRGGSLK